MPIAPLARGSTLGGGRYRIDRVLGSGGFGITYLVFHTGLESRYVIKELAFEGTSFRDTNSGQIIPHAGQECNHIRLVDRFCREARYLSKLRHRNVVRVTDVWEELGTAYFVMEFAEGTTLEQAVYEGRLSGDRSEIVSIADQILEALEAVHEEGLTHGDIKPDNILLSDDSHVLLIDFGTARADFDLARTVTLVAFTPGYAPPELMQPDRIREAGPWSDLYSWAMVIYGLVVGHPGLRGLPIDAYCRLVGEDPYRGCADELQCGGLPAGYAHAVEASLRLDPQDRPENVEALRAMLDPSKVSESGPVLVVSPAYNANTLQIDSNTERKGAHGWLRERWFSRRWSKGRRTNRPTLYLAATALVSCIMTAALLHSSTAPAFEQTVSKSSVVEAAGTISLVSNVLDAAVHVDGIQIALVKSLTIPNLLGTAAGSHELRVMLDGYRPLATDIEVSAGETTVVDVDLVKLGEWNWASSATSPTGGYVSPQYATMDGSGNLVVGGQFSGTAVMSSDRLVSAGRQDPFISSYDLTGNLLWTTAFGGDGEWDQTTCLESDGGGNIYVAGQFSGTAVFENETVESFGGADGFVARFTDAGELNWVVTGGGSGSDSIVDLVVGDGDPIVSGTFSGAIDLSGTIIEAGTDDGHGSYVARFNQYGELEWAQPHAGGVLAFDSTTGVIIAAGARWMDGVSQRLTVTQLRSNGNISWQTNFPIVSDNLATVSAIAMDSEGEIVIIGGLSGTIELNGSEQTARGTSDAFVARFGPSGQLRFFRLFSGSIDGNDSGRWLAIDDAHRVFVAMSLFSEIEPDDSQSTATAVRNQAAQIVMARLDETGEIVWQQTSGQVCAGDSFAAQLDQDGQIYVAGCVGEHAPFVREETPETQHQELFVASFDAEGNLSWASTAGGEHGVAAGLLTHTNGDVFLFGNSGRVPSSSQLCNGQASCAFVASLVGR